MPCFLNMHCRNTIFKYYPNLGETGTNYTRKTGPLLAQLNVLKSEQALKTLFSLNDEKMYTANKRTESGPEIAIFVTLKTRDGFCNCNFSKTLYLKKKNHWVKVSASKLLED